MSLSFPLLSNWTVITLKLAFIWFLLNFPNKKDKVSVLNEEQQLCSVLAAYCARLLWTRVPSSQVLSSLSIWNIYVQARLAMPSLASCFLPIDFSSVYPHPSISRGGGGCLSSALEHQSSSPRPPPDPGLFTIPAWMISAETLEQLQTSEDNPRCWKRGKEGGGAWSVCSSGELCSLERDCQ